jgi:site-specific recombinase XerD
MIKSVARKAGIPEEDVSNHVLRRSGARLYLGAGGKIEEISVMLGHTDTRMTMRYLGITVDQLRKLQEIRDDYLDLVRMRMNENIAVLVQQPQKVLFAR